MTKSGAGEVAKSAPNPSLNQGLVSRRCEACVRGTPPIDTARAAQLQKQINPAWTLEETRISRQLKFRNFRDAFAFATKVADIAETEGHHPDLAVGWGYVRVTLTTHAARGLTDNDFIMAAKVDGAVKQRSGSA